MQEDGNYIHSSQILSNQMKQQLNFNKKELDLTKLIESEEADICAGVSQQENSETLTNIKQCSENNVSFSKLDNDDVTKFLHTSNSSTTCKSISCPGGSSENASEGYCFNVKSIEDTTFNTNVTHFSEPLFKNQTNAFYNQQFSNELQEEQNPDQNNAITSINSLNHIQYISIRNISEEECISGRAYFQHGNDQQDYQYLKNSNLNCLIIPKEEVYDEVEQRVFQFNKIQSDAPNNFGNIISTGDNSLRTLNPLQSKINNNQIIMPNQSGCMNISHSFLSKENSTTLFQQPSIIYSENHYSPNYLYPLSSNQYIPNQKYQQIMRDPHYLQQANFVQKSEDFMDYTETLSSQTPNSNECIPSNDQENASSSSSYDCKLKVEHSADDISYKREELSQQNSSHHLDNNCNNLSQLIKDPKEEENSMEEERSDLCCDDKKQNFIKKITDQDSYWNKFTERDDEYLLKLYEKIDKNNVNKNILSSFLRYILEKGDDIVVECLDSKQKELNTIRKELKNFTRNKKLNNNTINSFFNSKRYSEQFQYYLKFYAMDYFTKSKVKDKYSHYICVAFFLRCFYNSIMRENIVIYNKSKYFKTINKKRYISSSNCSEQSTKASEYTN